MNTNAPRSFQEETLAQVEALRRVDPDFADVEGTVFDNVAEVFETFCDEMIDTMTTQCVKDLRSKCSGYKKERYMYVKMTGACTCTSLDLSLFIS